MDRYARMTFATLRQEWRVATTDDLPQVQMRLKNGFEVWMCDCFREVIDAFGTFFIGPHVLEEVEGQLTLQGHDHLARRPAQVRLQCIAPYQVPLYVLEARTCLYPGWRGIHHGRTQLYIPVRH